jgi:hypothetical protein
MKIYREIQQFGGNEEESSRPNDLVPRLLNGWREVGDINWVVGDIHCAN